LEEEVMACIRLTAWADVARGIREYHMNHPEEYEPAMGLNWPAWQRVAEGLKNHLESNPSDGELSMPPSEMAVYMKAFNEEGVEMHGMPKDGQYYSTKTLLGCEPGECRNKRFVYCWPSDKPVLVMNDRMDIWTAVDEGRLQIILDALNAETGK
jgi:hypothetical protein